MAQVATEQHFFQVSPQQINGESFQLREAESHHLIRVLRLRQGATIWLLDGVGTAYRARVEDISSGQVQGRILQPYPNYGEMAIPLHLGLGLLKKDRMEWAAEKATELGVRSLTPLLLERCVKRSFRRERLTKVVQAAAKQCGRCLIPQVSEAMSLDQWLAHCSQGQILMCTQEADLTISDWYRTAAPCTTDLCVLVGPEGDFSPREKVVLDQAHVTAIRLGPRRLRSETAVVTALAIVNELIQKQGEHHG